MLRNKEFRQFAILFALMATAAITAGFAINPAAGLLTILSVSAFGISFFTFTKARYQSIAQIASQIDLVLHHADQLYIAESNEGELSILHSEITKMSLRIREQNEALKKEKEHLANALADIAHQLRTPLTSANLILSLLENNPDEKDRKTLVREAEELFVQVDWLLTTLLKLSRLDAGIVVFQKEQIDLNRLIQAALRPFLISMELHDLTMHVDAPDGINIWGDFGWLSEALQNIFKNCMESAGDQGQLTILCTDNPLFTEIAIKDNGAGFHQEDLPHLFDRFYRGKNTATAGYGIGLALCKMIITRQGGSITAKNKPEGGAMFIIRFPK